MGNGTDYTGACYAPFLDASLFPSEGGYIQGRFCAQISLIDTDPTCCLPCPATDWIYPDSFETYSTVAGWLNVVGLILLLFLLLSYVFLPTQTTRSHYLSTCLIVSVGFIALGFTIPLGASPEQCYNEITPNDMYSSTECAFSGAFIVAGGLSAIVWVFIRALSMNLQICWDIVPGRKFFYSAQALGWGIPAALFTATMTKTGVSFRFGDACHVNHADAMADFWGPLLGFAAAAGILQFMTLGYCIHIYLKNLWADESHGSTVASGSGGLPSYQQSVRGQTARAVFQRLKKVLWLQWRGIFIVSIILIDVIFFSIVFVYLDGVQHTIAKDWTSVEPWLICLAAHPTDKDICVEMISHVLVNEGTVVAVLLLLSLAGFQVFFFLARPTLIPAWAVYIQGKFSGGKRKQEFISLDARHLSAMPGIDSKNQVQQYNHIRGHQKTTFEMQPTMSSLETSMDMKSPATSTVLSSPDGTYRSPGQHFDSPSFNQDYRDPQAGRSLNPQLGSLDSPPAPAYTNHTTTRLNTQLGDYFDQSHAYQQLQRKGFIRKDSNETTRQGRVSPLVESGWVTSRPDSRDHERRYKPSQGSFSNPRPPSRHSSQKSVSFAEVREAYGKEVGSGLGLDPTSEISDEDESLSGLEPSSQSLDSRHGRRRR